MRQETQLLEMIPTEDKENWELEHVYAENSIRQLKNVRKILDTITLFASDEDKLGALEEINEYLESIGY